MHIEHTLGFHLISIRIVKVNKKKRQLMMVRMWSKENIVPLLWVTVIGGANRAKKERVG